jgi:hypothetical protein
MSMSMTYLKRTMRDILHYSYLSGASGNMDVEANHHKTAEFMADLVIENQKAESDKADKAYKAYKKYEEGTITADEALRAIAAIYAFDV